MPSMETDMSSLIDYESAVSYLANVRPQVARAVAELRDDWAPDTPPSIVTMSTIGRTVASIADAERESDLEQVFSLIERLLVHGDESVKNAIATGLLESLLAAASAKRVDFRRVAPHLGKESRRYCQEWDRFTGCITPGLD
jgi:hypothetical protein